MNIEQQEAIHFAKPRTAVQIRPGQDSESNIRGRLKIRFGWYSGHRAQERFNPEQFDQLLDDIQRYQQLRPDYYLDAVASVAALQSFVLALPESLAIDWPDLRGQLLQERGCQCSRCGRTTYMDKLKPERKAGANRYVTDPLSFELVCDRCSHAGLLEAPVTSIGCRSLAKRKMPKFRATARSGRSCG